MYWTCLVLLGLAVVVWICLLVTALAWGWVQTVPWLAVVHRYHYVLMGVSLLMAVVGLMGLTALRPESSFEPTRFAPGEPERPEPERVARLVEWLGPRRKPCIAYGDDRKLPVTLGCSKEGGTPDLPAGRRYPLHDDGSPLGLLFQLRCSDLAPLDPDGRYPHCGMIYFFEGGLVLFSEREDNLVATDPLGGGKRRWLGDAMEFMEADDYPDFFLARRAVPDATWADYQEALCQLGYTVRFGQLGGYLHPENEEAFERLTDLDDLEVLLSDNDEYAYLISPDDLRLRSFANACLEWS
ncbi:MAG: DUF1963 domain-containing protein [Bacteroidales bacterium]|nr:DUF1963 domain-containing protein [Bacteroidales bacterium]